MCYCWSLFAKSGLRLLLCLKGCILELNVNNCILLSKAAKCKLNGYNEKMTREVLRTWSFIYLAIIRMISFILSFQM